MSITIVIINKRCIAMASDVFISHDIEARMMNGLMKIAVHS